MTNTQHPTNSRRGRTLVLILLLLIAAGATFAIASLLINIYGHKQAQRTPFVRLVEVDETTTDPEPWGTNWPNQFDSYKRTVDTELTRYGGSSAMPEQKLDEDPWLRRLFAGYAFSIDYREKRGHAYMLHDQKETERVTKVQQSGACLHCHASIIPTYRRIGLEELGKPADAQALGADFNWPAVEAGFKKTSTMPFHDVLALVDQTPDGTDTPSAHPVSCVDCHDPDTMRIRVTRPGFIKGIAALAASDAEVPHLPSITRWRESLQTEPYHPNTMASRQEMRSFTCGQCHVEYYCASKETLFFPWENGLKAEQIEQTFDLHTFPDGSPFSDYTHGETGAKSYKAQHPEFELWSQGIHARAGVSCADCHMPYEREGAMKVSSHWVRSPLLNINNACQTCHQVPEQELEARVHAIQDRTRSLIDRAAVALTDMLDAIRAAQAAGATDEQLEPILELQKKAMWRLDFIASENSMGFHADQEAARVLAESIDYSRQAQILAQSLRTPDAPDSTRPIEPIQGVTPKEKAPPGRYKTDAPASNQ